MAVPAGITIPWPSTAASIPANWSRVTALDAKYVKGVPTAATNPGTTGGQATHTHAGSATHVHDLTHTHTGSGSSSSGTGTITDAVTGTVATADATHTHTKSGLLTSGAFNSATAQPGSDAQSNDPSNLVVIWIESDGTPTGIPANALALFNSASLPASWTLYTDAKTRFLKGAAAAGDGGTTAAGNVAHTHTVDAHTHAGTSHGHTSSASGGGSVAGPLRTAGTAIPAQTHTHTPTATNAATGTLASVSGGASGSQNNEPPWTKQAIIQNGTGGQSLPNGIIAIWRGTIANIPAGWVICDGNNGTPNLLTKYVQGANDTGEIGNTGGSASAHSHTAPGNHQHTIGAHLHALNNASPTLETTTAGSTSARSSATHTHTWGDSDNDSTNPAAGAAASLSNNGAGTNEPPFEEVAYLQFQLLAPRVLADTVQVVETMLRPLALRRPIGDAVQIVEQLLSIKDLARVLTDALDVVDLALRRLALKREQAEAVQIAEAQLRLLALRRQAADTVDLGEGLVRPLTLRRLLSETVNIVEGLAHAFQGNVLIKALSDTIQLSEAALRRLALVRRAEEAVQLGDIPLRFLTLRRLLTETVHIPESLLGVFSGPGQALVKVLGETLQLVDGLLAALTPSLKNAVVRIRRGFQARIDRPNKQARVK